MNAVTAIDTRSIVIDALKGMTTWNEFAKSLVDQFTRKGSLTEKQWDAANRMVAKVGATAARKERLTCEMDVSRISRLLDDAAKSKLKRPVFHAADLSFSLAPSYGRNSGAVYVKGDETYLGKIMGGLFQPSGAATFETVQAVRRVAEDPLGAAVQYGRMTGRCACCNRKLSDPKSVELGIGPVCKDRWGL